MTRTVRRARRKEEGGEKSAWHPTVARTLYLHQTLPYFLPSSRSASQPKALPASFWPREVPPSSRVEEEEEGGDEPGLLLLLPLVLVVVLDEDGASFGFPADAEAPEDEPPL